MQKCPIGKMIEAKIKADFKKWQESADRFQPWMFYSEKERKKFNQKDRCKKGKRAIHNNVENIDPVELFSH
jgi:hypothetical protein